MAEKLLVYTKQFPSLSSMFSMDKQLNVIAGPCSIENEEQLDRIAKHLAEKNKVY